MVKFDLKSFKLDDLKKMGADLVGSVTSSFSDNKELVPTSIKDRLETLEKILNEHEETHKKTEELVKRFIKEAKELCNDVVEIFQPKENVKQEEASTAKIKTEEEIPKETQKKPDAILPKEETASPSKTDKQD